MNPPYILPMVVLFLALAVLIGIVFLTTQDAPKRGFSWLQVYLIRVASVIFFPVALIVYLIFRPSVRV